MGTGTTAVACKEMDLNCYGSELSKEQVDFALERVGETITEGRNQKFSFEGLL